MFVGRAQVKAEDEASNHMISEEILRQAVRKALKKEGVELPADEDG